MVKLKRTLINWYAKRLLRKVILTNFYQGGDAAYECLQKMVAKHPFLAHTTAFMKIATARQNNRLQEIFMNG